MAQRLRIGIIGCGVIAPAHVESYQKLDDVEVVWACDKEEPKAAALAEQYGIPKVGTDYRAVLANGDVDAVSVCTDHASHAPISVAAIEAGKHVLCEKALAAVAAGLDEMFAAHARHPDCIFAGVFQHRFDSAIQYLKELVDGDAFGRIVTAGVQVRCYRGPEYYRKDAWRGTWAEEGGAVVINQAIHFIDSLCWVMGGVEAIAGRFANLTHGDCIETEDTAVAALRFRRGALGTLEATSSSHFGWETTLAIHGAEGGVELRQGQAMKVDFRDETKQAEIREEFARRHDAKTIEAGKSYYGPSH
ncbi:MAG: Gfo/Idh/MocA family protein, partial [Planctomycetota bacterium]